MSRMGQGSQLRPVVCVYLGHLKGLLRDPYVPWRGAH